MSLHTVRTEVCNDILESVCRDAARDRDANEHTHHQQGHRDSHRHTRHHETNWRPADSTAAHHAFRTAMCGRVPTGPSGLQWARPRPTHCNYGYGHGNSLTLTTRDHRPCTMVVSTPGRRRTGAWSSGCSLARPQRKASVTRGRHLARSPWCSGQVTRVSCTWPSSKGCEHDIHVQRCNTLAFFG